MSAGAGTSSRATDTCEHRTRALAQGTLAVIWERSAVIHYFNLVTRWLPERIAAIEANIKEGRIRPTGAKKKLAWEILAHSFSSEETRLVTVSAPPKVDKPLDICQLANHNATMDGNYTNHLGRILKQQRINRPLTLQELAAKAGVSASHLGRIERGERFPSAHILRKIAGPLDFEENELFTLAGYLSAQPTMIEGRDPGYVRGQLDPYVARILSQEPIEVQRAVFGILTMLKSIAKGMDRES